MEDEINFKFQDFRAILSTMKHKRVALRHARVEIDYVFLDFLFIHNELQNSNSNIVLFSISS